MVLKLSAVLEVSWRATVIGRLSCLGVVLHLAIDLLAALFELLLFVQELKILTGVLIQIELEVCFLLKVFV